MGRRRQGWQGLLPRGRTLVLGLRVFSLLQAGILGEVLGGFQHNVHQLSRCAFSGSWSSLVSVRAGGHWSLQLVLDVISREVTWCVW